MNHRPRFVGAAFIVAALIMLFGAQISSAQGLNWNCQNTTICNCSPCDAQLTVVTTPPGAFPIVFIPAGQCITIPTPPGLTITGVTDFFGVFHPIQPPPSPCNCKPTDWSVCCVPLPPVPCCFDICFDPCCCLITLRTALCPHDQCFPPNFR